MKLRIKFDLAIYLPVILGFLFSHYYALAQLKSDPDATKILNQLSSKFSDYQDYNITFQMETTLPESDPVRHSGEYFQKGNKFKVGVADRIIYVDGKNAWVQLSQDKEVQINCLNEFEAEGIITPSSIFSLYQTGEYDYFSSEPYRENGTLIQQIEFKPIDLDSDFSKVRLTLLHKDKSIHRFRIFYKDGTRVTLYIDEIKINQNLDDKIFVWTKDDCPDCYLEDLRFDCQ